MRLTSCFNCRSSTGSRQCCFRVACPSQFPAARTAHEHSSEAHALVIPIARSMMSSAHQSIDQGVDQTQLRNKQNKKQHMRCAWEFQGLPMHASLGFRTLSLDRGLGATHDTTDNGQIHHVYASRSSTFHGKHAPGNFRGCLCMLHWVSEPSHWTAATLAVEISVIAAGGFLPASH